MQALAEGIVSDLCCKEWRNVLLALILFPLGTAVSARHRKQRKRLRFRRANLLV